MKFAQIFTPGLAQCSYVIGSGKQCLVVDPVRHIEPYLQQARDFEMEIVAILETHLHADFISGQLELAERTGAPIYAPRAASCIFPHRALSDGETFTVEHLKFQLLETPGHTPEGAVYVVSDLERGDEPVLVFTGDTLLIGDVGRPDLFPGQEQELAQQLFSSLQRLAALPDHVEVYPAHGMGSLCGRALSAKLWSTIGTEKRHNYALRHQDPESFIRDLLRDMPAAPDHFSRCSEINRRGAPLLRKLQEPRSFTAREAAAALENGKIAVDVRPYHSFAAAFIPGAYSISHHGNLATFAGWVLPPDQELLLVLEREEDLAAVQKALYSVGLDRIAGYLEGAMESWVNAGLPLHQIETVSVEQLRDWLAHDSPVVLDNRAAYEWGKGHINGTLHVPAPDIRQLYTRWNPDDPLVVLCNTSNRSMTAASLLKQRGFKRVINALGGTTAWTAAGYELQEG